MNTQPIGTDKAVSVTSSYRQVLEYGVPGPTLQERAEAFQRFMGRVDGGVERPTSGFERGSGGLSKAVRDQVLIVSVARRGGEVLNDPSTAGDVVLGEWPVYRGRSTGMDFDPDRIAAVVGCFRGRTLAVFDTVAGTGGSTWDWSDLHDGPPRRVRFHGEPSERLSALVGAESPAKWRQGDRWPVKVVALDDLLIGPAGTAVELPDTTESDCGGTGEQAPLPGDASFLTVAEATSVMLVSKMTVYRLIRRGELPAIRIGRSFRLPEQAVHDYLAGMLDPAPPA